jgi:AcrR family transcriptional regulator
MTTPVRLPRRRGVDESNTAPLQQRIIAAAANLTTTAGWTAVTMSALADIVGVSRQTVYNEIGSKTALADAMVTAELGHFLTLIRSGFEEHPDDVVAALRVSIERVLQQALHNALLQAILSATHGAQSDLLPLITTRAGAVMTNAAILIRELLDGYDLPLTHAYREAMIDVVVRTVLSHVVQPSVPPAEAAAAITGVIAAGLSSAVHNAGSAHGA